MVEQSSRVAAVRVSVSRFEAALEETYVGQQIAAVVSEPRLRYELESPPKVFVAVVAVDQPDGQETAGLSARCQFFSCDQMLNI
jgi:hypothetical protein